MNGDLPKWTGGLKAGTPKLFHIVQLFFCRAAAREQFDRLIERRSGKATSFTTLRAKIIANQLILRYIYIVQRANAIIVLDPQLMRSIKFHLRRK
jgi:hypothetical protein